MGFSKYVQGNPIVFVGKLPGVHLTCRTIGNKGNATVGMCEVPSAVNVFYTLDSDTETKLDRARDLPTSGPEAEALVELGCDPSSLVVRVAKVAEPTPLHVRRALARHRPDAVTLDLRGNPGGDLDAAVRLTELFLARGSIVARQRFGDGSERVLRTRLEPSFDGLLRVLVDRGTASAAEVVAAALKHHGRAAVVGERTFGKGTVQAFTPDGLRTVATVVDPSGEPIDGVGVTVTHEDGSEGTR
jgi:carboxyl-terminal processing protease